MSYRDPPAETTPRTAREEDECFILLRGELTDWEEKFVKSLYKSRRWSAKQRIAFENVRKKYLKRPDEVTCDRPSDSIGGERSRLLAEDKPF